jgi:hypothetical protein
MISSLVSSQQNYAADKEYPDTKSANTGKIKTVLDYCPIL